MGGSLLNINYIPIMSTNTVDKPRKVTTATVAKMKAAGEKIAMITAYDYTMATLVDRSGIDLILVGDSAANVMAGYETTLPMTLEKMIYHTQCVTRGAQRAMVICDMPFGSYQGDPLLALHSAVKVMKESGAAALKLEGGSDVADVIAKIVGAGIPVMGHLGLTPQSVNKFGGYGIRAKEEAEANKLMEDARLLQQVGCFALVLEKVPAALAARVAKELTIPVIGIGAGPDCDGQVLVLQDMLGLNDGFRPKFLRRYAELAETVVGALDCYAKDVKAGAFPTMDESY